MATILTVYIIDAGDETVKVGHQFYGLTEAEARTYYREHLLSCDYFKSAERDGCLVEEIEEVDEEDLPEFDTEEEDEEEAG